MASVHTVMAYNNRMLLKSLNIRPAVSRIVHSPREILRLYSVADLPSADVLVSTAFNIANFGPQPFWLLMILFPTSEITKAFMKPWTTVIFFVLVHFFIVVTSITQPDGSAPIAEVRWLCLASFYYQYHLCTLSCSHIYYIQNVYSLPKCSTLPAIPYEE